jgi:hypothetical protein
MSFVSSVRRRASGSRERDGAVEKATEDVVVPQLGENAPDRAAIREIADDGGDVVVTVRGRLTAEVEQNHLFHIRPRSLDLALIGREARRRLLRADVGERPGGRAGSCV